MKYRYSYSNHYWHIMIPVDSNECGRKCVIASCTNLSIINIPVPSDLGRHIEVIYLDSGIKLDNPEIELKYSLICPNCLKLYDKEEIKFNLIVYKLKGKEK